MFNLFMLEFKKNINKNKLLTNCYFLISVAYYTMFKRNVVAAMQKKNKFTLKKLKFTSNNRIIHNVINAKICF